MRKAILELKRKIKESVESDIREEAKLVSMATIDHSNWRERWKDEIIFLENKIEYVDYSGNHNAFLINNKFVYYPSSGKWRTFGKNKHYRSKGAQDFIDRFVNSGVKLPLKNKTTR